MPDEKDWIKCKAACRLCSYVVDDMMIDSEGLQMVKG